MNPEQIVAGAPYGRIDVLGSDFSVQSETQSLTNPAVLRQIRLTS